MELAERFAYSRSRSRLRATWLAGSGRLSCNVHREIIGARRSPVVAVAVLQIAVVIDAVASPKNILGSGERQRKRPTLHSEIFAGSSAVRWKGAGVDPRRQSHAHQFELNAGEHWREAAPFDTRSILDNALIGGAHDDHARGGLLINETTYRRIECCRDLAHEDRRHFLTALDGRQHADADPRPLGQSFKR